MFTSWVRLSVLLFIRHSEWGNKLAYLVYRGYLKWMIQVVVVPLPVL